MEDKTKELLNRMINVIESQQRISESHSEYIHLLFEGMSLIEKSIRRMWFGIIFIGVMLNVVIWLL